jgi:hypothetical protein
MITIRHIGKEYQKNSKIIECAHLFGILAEDYGTIIIENETSQQTLATFFQLFDIWDDLHTEAIDMPNCYGLSQVLTIPELEILEGLNMTQVFELFIFVDYIQCDRLTETLGAFVARQIDEIGDPVKSRNVLDLIELYELSTV